jgi:hypothetical protein
MRLCDFHPSFGITVVAKDGSPAHWIQVREPGSQRIASFSQISPADSADVDLLTDRPIRIGDPYVHAFLDRKGDIYLDTAAELKLQFNVALNDKKTSSAVKLAIIEQMSEPGRTRQTRDRLVDRFNRAFGERAAQSFENSAARSNVPRR